MSNISFRLTKAEALEPRRLLASFAARALHGVLRINGTDQNDVISVKRSSDGIFQVSLGNQTLDFSQFAVKSIALDAGGGDDRISVGVNRPCTVMGGDGNDVI